MTASRSPLRFAAIVVLIPISFVSACGSKDAADAEAIKAAAKAEVIPPQRVGCDQNNGGLTLPEGFCASVFAENLGHARHLAIAANGDVYVNTWSSKYNKMTNVPGGFIVALRDADQDGRAEIVQRFGTPYDDGKAGGGTGIALFNGALYVEAYDQIVRYRLDPASLVPATLPDTIVSGLPLEGDHLMHPFAIAPDGTLFVNSGSMTDSCQEQNRTPGSRGSTPCRELTTHAGIWRYDVKRLGQTFSAQDRFATGARNTVALAIHPRDGALYAAIHGRDQLADNWPKLYTAEQNNELPAEIFARVGQNNDFGWPYCYYDPSQGKYVLAPEYGGDGGKAVGPCAEKTAPLLTFPAHWAPEAIAFYTGNTFPDRYREGAFVAFHGSWTRTPQQSGFLVAFVPFAEGQPSGRYEEFATGFTGTPPVTDPAKAQYRPMGLAVGPDGALFVSDDQQGRIWRITRRK